MREIGPAFKVFANAELGREGQNDTKPYIGAARLLLGVLKNQMALGGLQQGRMHRDLPDGTRIVVDSRYGIDKFAIIAPSAEVPTREEESYPIPPPVEERVPVEIPTQEIDAFWAAACGQCTPDVLGQAAVWPTLTSQPRLICAEVSLTSEALAISDNGTTVVGVYTPIGSGSARAFRWTSRDGVFDIPVPAHPSTAVAVSANGGVIGGRCVGGPYLWTTDGGFEFVPDIDLDGSVVCVSPSGEYAAGVETFMDGADARAATWVARREGTLWKKRRIDNPGTSSRRDRFQGPDTGPTPDIYSPVNVDDAGRLTLIDSSATGSFIPQHNRGWEFHTSGPYTDGTGATHADGEWFVASPVGWYQTDQPTGGRFHRYTWSDEQIVPLAAGGARSTADDVQVVIGTDNYGDRLPWFEFPITPGAHIYTSGGVHIGDNPAFQIAFTNYIAESVARSWWWSARRGQVFLQPDGAAVTDISEDGVVIVGYVPEGAGRRPVYWIRGRGVNSNAMPFIGSGGHANSVARPRTPKVSV